MVNSGNKRKKLYSQESTTIVDGDVVELIPGHHFFKYVTLAGDKGEEPSLKRSRQTFDHVALTTKSQVGWVSLNLFFLFKNVVFKIERGKMK